MQRIGPELVRTFGARKHVDHEDRNNCNQTDVGNEISNAQREIPPTGNVAIMPAGQKPDRFLQSPYYYLLDNNLQHIRRRLMQEGPAEFPIFEDLRKDAITDYLAFVQPFGDGSVQGMMGSWSTDHHNGFSDDMIDALLRMQNHLAVAAKMAVLGKLANNMLTTYLGGDAGRRVMSGQIKRGDGETIRAALVMADMLM